MLTMKRRAPQVIAMFFAALLGVVLCVDNARAQGAAQDGLAVFPADTQQFAYSNLSELRSNPQYPLIRDHLLSPELRSLEEFLVPAGINPEKDINDVVLGWRGDVKDTSRFFGIAEGEFDSDRVQNYFVTNKLPIQHYLGYDLYGFGSGASRTDLYFTFLSAEEAAFGRIGDLKALLDVHAGTSPPLSSNTKFNDWENELEGTAPQWGIATGQAAANEAMPWLAAGRKLDVNATALFGPIKAVLYHVDWQNGVVAHLSVLCQGPQSAQGLSQLLTLLRNARPAANGNSVLPTATVQVLQAMQFQVNGSRLELDATASLNDLTQLLNAPPKGQ
jgi:hypothetical protein